MPDEILQQVVRYLQGPNGPFVVIAISVAAILLIVGGSVGNPNRRRIS